MGTLPERFILLDLEYTSWKGALERRWSGPGEYREAVQIGALLVARRCLLTVEGEFSVLTLPARNPVLSDYFVELTGITQEQLAREGVSFPSGFASFVQFARGTSCPIYTWGDDESLVRENCEFYGIDFDSYFHARFFDVRPIFARHGVAVEKYQSGTVHQAVGAVLAGNPHNALFDVQSMLLALRELEAAHP